MNKTEEYFSIQDKMSGTPVVRRVFIASDDPSVIIQARETYLEPKWVIYGDPKVADDAAVNQRYSTKGLNSIGRQFKFLTHKAQHVRLLFATTNSQRARKFVSLWR
jgi:hypothetical protein